MAKELVGMFNMKKDELPKEFKNHEEDIWVITNTMRVMTALKGFKIEQLENLVRKRIKDTDKVKNSILEYIKKEFVQEQENQDEKRI